MSLWAGLGVFWLISLIAAGGVGYHYSKVVGRVNTLARLLMERRQQEPEPPQGRVIDPDDPAQQVRREFEETTKKLNQ